jgi:hypothetical protein
LKQNKKLFESMNKFKYCAHIKWFAPAEKAMKTKFHILISISDSSQIFSHKRWEWIKRIYIIGMFLSIFLIISGNNITVCSMPMPE